MPLVIKPGYRFVAQPFAECFYAGGVIPNRADAESRGYTAVERPLTFPSASEQLRVYIPRLRPRRKRWQPTRTPRPLKMAIAALGSGTSVTTPGP